MISKIGVEIRKIRNWFNRSYWAIRLLRLSKSEKTSTAPGLVLIQIDGLSFNQYQRALKEKNLPFIRSLIRKQNYKEYEHYSGMPSNTPAVQGELFYGVKGCVPAFNFIDKQSSETFVMFDPKNAIEIESRISRDGESLLKGGSSYSNIFKGGADESHYCAAGGGYSRIFKIFNPVTWVLIIIFHLNIFFRTLILFIFEILIGIFDFIKGALAGKKIQIEFKYILARAVICVLLRELVVIGAKIDIARGLPIIHLNLVGYDEQAHWRGPSSKFAHWSLRGIDDAVRRIWKETKIAERRDYDIWIYSDHGQEDAVPYAEVTGRSLEEAVSQIFGEIDNSGIVKRRVRFSHEERVEHVSSKVKALGMGPIVHIYPSEELTADEMDRVISELLGAAKIPVVLIPKKGGEVEALTLKGKFILPRDAGEILGKEHPFLKEAALDLVSLCHHPSAGKIIISGECEGEKNIITFAAESGCHAGYGPEETRGVALLPPDAPLNLKGRVYLRPLDIREAALRHLGRNSKFESEPRVHEVKTLRVMTYNVHACAGLDGKTSPDRIVRVIARQNPDIVALQEIDVGRNRSGNIDQAQSIAHKLGMVFHFHPSVSLAEGKYGNAILSRYPLRIIRSDALPRLKARNLFEPRAALWVEIDLNGIKVNIITSHLSLWPEERFLQTEALLGPDWIGGVCQGPVILCGDFNASPRSKVCRRIGGKLRDAQLTAQSHKPKSTWLASHPFSRIDHFFISPEIKVENISVPSTELDRIASDHLPLIADFKF